MIFFLHFFFIFVFFFFQVCMVPGVQWTVTVNWDSSVHPTNVAAVVPISMTTTKKPVENVRTKYDFYVAK